MMTGPRCSTEVDDFPISTTLPAYLLAGAQADLFVTACCSSTYAGWWGLFRNPIGGGIFSAGSVPLRESLCLVRRVLDQSKHGAMKPLQRMRRAMLQRRPGEAQGNCRHVARRRYAPGKLHAAGGAVRTVCRRLADGWIPGWLAHRCHHQRTHQGRRMVSALLAGQQSDLIRELAPRPSSLEGAPRGCVIKSVYHSRSPSAGSAFDVERQLDELLSWDDDAPPRCSARRQLAGRSRPARARISVQITPHASRGGGGQSRPRSTGPSNPPPLDHQLARQIRPPSFRLAGPAMPAIAQQLARWRAESGVPAAGFRPRLPRPADPRPAPDRLLTAASALITQIDRT